MHTCAASSASLGLLLCYPWARGNVCPYPELCSSSFNGSTKTLAISGCGIDPNRTEKPGATLCCPEMGLGSSISAESWPHLPTVPPTAFPSPKNAFSLPSPDPLTSTLAELSWPRLTTLCHQETRNWPMWAGAPLCASTAFPRERHKHALRCFFKRLELAQGAPSIVSLGILKVGPIYNSNYFGVSVLWMLNAY